MTKTPRNYGFPLPVTVPGVEIFLGWGQIEGSGLLEKLPPDLRKAITEANSPFGDLVITKEMCDGVDDETWKQIAKLLNLKYTFIHTPHTTTTVVTPPAPAPKKSKK